MQPAIDLAETGFPVAPVAAYAWGIGFPDLYRPGNPHGGDLLLNGKAPKAGEVMRMPQLARTFRVGISFAIQWLKQMNDTFTACCLPVVSSREWQTWFL